MKLYFCYCYILVALPPLPKMRTTIFIWRLVPGSLLTLSPFSSGVTLGSDSIFVSWIWIMIHELFCHSDDSVFIAFHLRLPVVLFKLTNGVRRTLYRTPLCFLWFAGRKWNLEAMIALQMDCQSFLVPSFVARSPDSSNHLKRFETVWVNLVLRLVTRWYADADMQIIIYIVWV